MNLVTLIGTHDITFHYSHQQKVRDKSAKFTCEIHLSLVLWPF